MGNAAW